MSDPSLPRGAKGEPPQYFDDPDVGKLLSMVVALAGEMAVMRDRLDTVERLLDAGQPVTREALAGFAPDEAVRTERDAWRQQFLSIVFRVLHEERERLAREPNPRYDDVVRSIESAQDRP
jgi:hypothetical protein